MAKRKQTQKKKVAKKSPTHKTDRDLVREHVKMVLEVGGSEDLVDALDVIMQQVAEPGKHLAWLAAYDFDHSVVIGASMILSDLAEADAWENTQDALVSPALPVVAEALHNKALPDDRKTHLVSLYDALGGEISHEELSCCFKDFEGAMRQSLEELSESVCEAPEGIEELLQTVGLLCDDSDPDVAPPLPNDVGTGLAMGVHIGSVNPDAGASILAAVAVIATEHGVAPDAADNALETLRAIGTQQAAWYLAELGRMPAMGELGAMARDLARELLEEGVAPALTLPGKLSKAVVSGVDGCGSRSLHLFCHDPEGDMHGVVLLLNDIVGVKDAFCLHGLASEELDINEPGFISSPCTLAFAREVLADALAINEESNRPVPGRFFIFRPYLGGKEIVAGRRTPDLSAYKLDTLVSSPELVDGSADLVESDIVGGLYFASDAAYDYVASGGSLQRPLSKKKFETFVREIALQERDALLSRMAVNLEVEALAGHAREEFNSMGARTWLALKENIVPFHEVPFVRAMCAISANAIRTNLSYGFSTQAEVDAAVLQDQFYDDDEEDWDEIE